MIKLLRLPEVRKQTGLSKSSIYSMMSNGSFPRSVKLGERAVGWRSDDVEQWINLCVKTKTILNKIQSRHFSLNSKTLSILSSHKRITDTALEKLTLTY